MSDFNFPMVQLFEMVSGGEFNAYGVYLGNQFGIYQAMEECGAATTRELSLATGLREAHLEQWLLAQVEDGFITRSASTTGIHFRLDRRIAAVVTDRVAIDRLMSDLLPSSGWQPRQMSPAMMPRELRIAA